MDFLAPEIFLETSPGTEMCLNCVVWRSNDDSLVFMVTRVGLSIWLTSTRATLVCRARVVMFLMLHEIAVGWECFQTHVAEESYGVHPQVDQQHVRGERRVGAQGALRHSWFQ